MLAGAALLFLIAGVVVLCMTLALALATLVGPLAGGLIAAIVTFALAGLLGLWAKQEFGKLKSAKRPRYQPQGLRWRDSRGTDRYCP